MITFLDKISLLIFMSLAISIFLIIGKKEVAFLQMILVEVFFILISTMLLLLHINLVIKSIFIGLFFILSSFAIQLSNSLKSFITSRPRLRVVISNIGIINFVWIVIMGATITVGIYAMHTPPFNASFIFFKKVPSYNKLHLSEHHFNFALFLLNKIIETIMVLGSVLAACMTILWTGGIWWTSEKINKKIKYHLTTISAIKMVLAYFAIAMALLIWTGLPLFHLLNSF